jgi:hypothetical protein
MERPSELGPIEKNPYKANDAKALATTVKHAFRTPPADTSKIDARHK